jgi:hypothetical protein
MGRLPGASLGLSQLSIGRSDVAQLRVDLDDQEQASFGVVRENVDEPMPPAAADLDFRRNTEAMGFEPASHISDAACVCRIALPADRRWDGQPQVDIDVECREDSNGGRNREIRDVASFDQRHHGLRQPGPRGGRPLAPSAATTGGDQRGGNPQQKIARERRHRCHEGHDHDGRLPGVISSRRRPGATGAMHIGRCLSLTSRAHRRHREQASRTARFADVESPLRVVTPGSISQTRRRVQKPEGQRDRAFAAAERPEAGGTEGPSVRGCRASRSRRDRAFAGASYASSRRGGASAGVRSTRGSVPGDAQT